MKKLLIERMDWFGKQKSIKQGNKTVKFLISFLIFLLQVYFSKRKSDKIFKKVLKRLFFLFPERLLTEIKKFASIFLGKIISNKVFFTWKSTVLRYVTENLSILTSHRDRIISIAKLW